MRIVRRWLFALCFGFLSVAPVSAASTVTSVGDASISHDAQAGTWLLTAGGTKLTLALDPSHDFQIVGLTSVSTHPWTVGMLSDSTVTVNDVPLVFGSRAAGFVYENVTAKVVVPNVALQLDATFKVP